jgi:hypothetical protein
LHCFIRVGHIHLQLFRQIVEVARMSGSDGTGIGTKEQGGGIGSSIVGSAKKGLRVLLREPKPRVRCRETILVIVGCGEGISSKYFIARHQLSIFRILLNDAHFETGLLDPELPYPALLRCQPQVDSGPPPGQRRCCSFKFHVSAVWWATSECLHLGTF